MIVPSHEFFSGLNELTYVKPLEQCLGHSKHAALAVMMIFQMRKPRFMKVNNFFCSHAVVELELEFRSSIKPHYLHVYFSNLVN